MKMINCPHCGKEVPEGSKFCQFCGEKIAPQISAVKEDEPVQDQKPENKQIENKQPKEEKEKTKTKVWKWLTITVIVVLLGGVGYLLYDRSVHIAQIDELAGQNIELINDNTEFMQQNTELMTQITQTTQERDQAKIEKAQALQELRQETAQLNTIKKWANAHSSEYSSRTTYYAGSNAILVKAGETVKLSVIYKGQTTIWETTSNGNCTAEWIKTWDNSITSVKITGVKEGTTELIFSEGKDEDHLTERFRVLVIIY